jgi:hypothetical protein
VGSVLCTPLTAIFVSPYATESLAALKQAALYFDRIELQQHAISARVPTAEHAMIGAHFVSSIRPFVDDGLVTVRPPDRVNVVNSQVVQAAQGRAQQVIWENSRFIMAESPTGATVGREFIPAHITVPAEVRSVLETHFGPLKPGCELTVDFPYFYYGTLLTDALIAMAEGNVAITGSAVLDRCVASVLESAPPDALARRLDDAKTIAPRVAYELMDLYLPDVSSLSCEDILEARRLLEPELAPLRAELHRVTHQLLSQHEPTLLAAAIRDEAAAHVLPLMVELDRRVSSAPARSLVSRLPKTVLTAAPLFSCLWVVGVPKVIAALASIAVAALGQVAEHGHEQRQLKANGLYGLIKLKSTLMRWTYL